jgi:hypothetical protein
MRWALTRIRLYWVEGDPPLWYRVIIFEHIGVPLVGYTRNGRTGPRL